jgi:hypothetical protein
MLHEYVWICYKYSKDKAKNLILANNFKNVYLFFHLLSTDWSLTDNFNKTKENLLKSLFVCLSEWQTTIWVVEWADGNFSWIYIALLIYLLPSNVHVYQWSPKLSLFPSNHRYYAQNVKFIMKFDTFFYGLLIKRDKLVDHWADLLLVRCFFNSGIIL